VGVVISQGGQVAGSHGGQRSVVSEDVLLARLQMSKTTLQKLRRYGLPVMPAGRRDAKSYDLVAVAEWLRVTGQGPAAARRKTRAAAIELIKEMQAFKNEHGEQQ
jgi:phage terminase Nu1 subunit (DNA packaging protein)